MAFGFNFIAKGEYALFTRPEFAVERVSYDVPTPSALVGLISSVYWHPGVKYIIDEIRVYNPIAFANIRRNEVKDKVSYDAIKAQMEASMFEEIKDDQEENESKRKSKDPSIYTSIARTQRASLILKNVCYGVSAHFELTDSKDTEQSDEKAYAILSRRLKKGQHFSQPFFGCREFPAQVEWVEKLPESDLDYTTDLGYMLYDLVYEKDKFGNPLDKAQPRFYRPHIVNGVIDVKKWAKENIRC